MLRLKSSSIYYALFLSVVFGLFLGGMILFSSLNRQFSAQLDVQDILRSNAKSGIQYGQANYQELEVNKPQEINLFGEGIDSVLIEKKQWGAFTIISSTAHHKSSSVNKVALSGQMNNPSDPNLYLVDQGRPFSLCGATKLEGKCMIPKAGVKRAYIEGKNYQGDKMIYGTTGVSERSLPTINKDFVASLQKLSGEIRIWEDDQDSIVNSFSNEGLHFIVDHSAALENIYLNGQIVIEAKDSIFVGASSQLENVIIKSPVIYIEKGFVGTAQFLASERIVLEDEVTLLYPSVLGIIESDISKERNAQITVGEGSHVLASVFPLSENPNFRLPVQLSIEKEAEVDGLVYCQGRTQLKGTVKGNLFTQKFYLETAASKYENHLLDAQILDALPDDFVYISLFENANPLTQIQWLE
jgi:hypothetical protein